MLPRAPCSSPCESAGTWFDIRLCSDAPMKPCAAPTTITMYIIQPKGTKA